jgi:hypothetical protein
MQPPIEALKRFSSFPALALITLHLHRTTRVLLLAFWHRSSAAWLQALTHSFSSFRSQAMHPPRPSLWPRSEGRGWRGRKTMEETMRVLTIFELMRLSRIELCGLLRRSPTCCRTSPKAPPNAKPRTSTCGTSGPFWPGATSRPSETAPLPVFTGGGICRSRDSGKLIALLASCLAARPKQSCRASSDDL